MLHYFSYIYNTLFGEEEIEIKYKKLQKQYEELKTQYDKLKLKEDKNYKFLLLNIGFLKNRLQNDNKFKNSLRTVMKEYNII